MSDLNHIFLGAHVYFPDPDDGTISGHFTVRRIGADSLTDIDAETTIYLDNADGSELEALAGELMPLTAAMKAGHLEAVDLDSNDLIIRFQNFYSCECGSEWSAEWSSMCDDECPECDHSLSPYESHEFVLPEWAKLQIENEENAPKGRAAAPVEPSDDCWLCGDTGEIETTDTRHKQVSVGCPICVERDLMAEITALNARLAAEGK